MGRKNKKSNLEITSPPPPPPPPLPPTTTTSSSSSSSAVPSSSDDNDNEDDVSSNAPLSNTPLLLLPAPPAPSPQPSPTKRPPSKPTAPSTTTLALPASSSKRTLDDKSAPSSSKRAKLDSDIEPAAGVMQQKPLFQRLWSDEDEIVILKGMIDYRANKGTHPMTNVDDFLDSIRKSLHVQNATKAQIVSKVRRLKKRFFNFKKAESEKKKKIYEPHELAVLELSKCIWTGPDLGGYAEEEAKKDDNGFVVEEEEEEEEDELAGELDVELGFSREEGVVLREGVRMMSGAAKAEVRRVVQKSNVAYLEAYLFKLKALEIAATKFLQGIRDGQG